MRYLTKLMAIIEKAIVIGNFMGGNSLGHGQSFVSDNRYIKRCIIKQSSLQNPVQTISKQLQI